ncbi:uncharacterized protein LOC119595262 [Penaeus monodon]|uniref:uncharacterized protein LOC119595262 n=1 Tax=Penaeus monodon TaxID=6687 RepID=UPI0018A6D856|nr:uncharacterized protein LOC119595262 [Penaeus monodon]
MCHAALLAEIINCWIKRNGKDRYGLAPAVGVAYTRSQATTNCLRDSGFEFSLRKRRVEAYRGQVSQAEGMINRSRLDSKVGEPGDNVAVSIPAVDRDRGDPRNILGVIVSRDLDNDQYEIAVQSGVLKGQCSRNQFDLCPQRLLAEDDVNQDTAVSLREAVIAQSACCGQGFTRCNCSGLKKCSTNRCKCFKAKAKCNSRCHRSVNCANKC